MSHPDAPDVHPAVRAHVETALRELLLPEELDGWELRWELNERGRWQLVVDLMAGGERFLGFITEHGACYPIEDGLDTFTDGFEDFISESRFAWGQRGELHNRPWRGPGRAGT
jgi:hypothetical protein